MKNFILVALVAAIFQLLSCSTSADIIAEDCVDTNCIDYTSQYAAQAAFDADPECRNDLDADNDGEACEENEWTDYYNSFNSSGGSSGGSSGCPDTAACGCSGYNKSQCESNSCCKWTTGQGCGCA